MAGPSVWRDGHSALPALFQNLACANLQPKRLKQESSKGNMTDLTKQPILEAQKDPMLCWRPVGTLPGIGEQRAMLLRKLGIETCFDLLCHFPKDYEDWTTLLPMSELTDGQDQAFMAVVSAKPFVSQKGRLSIIRTTLKDDQKSIEAVWFNQRWVINKLTPGARYCFRGRIRKKGRQVQVQNPSFEKIEESDSTISPYRPIYGLTAGLTQGTLRRFIKTALHQLSGSIPEPLPDWVRRNYRLCAVEFAYNRIHQPENEQDLMIARQRIAFEELFLLRTGLWLLRQQRKKAGAAIPLKLDAAGEALFSSVVKTLPFSLTKAQQRSLLEIRQDLMQSQPMNRLLQGDVGSGKTVVAALAMLHCVLCGAQAVLMAPTSILAEQHHRTLTRLLSPSGLTPRLLTGATRPAERREILEGLETGDILLIVGTHALIEESVVFHRLGLAITDEQHRFGVRQRRQLSRSDEKSEDPHVLVMSATPIPRSLALVLYGDLDLSIMDEQPPGRTPVATYTATSRDRPRVERLMRRFVHEGRQVYVVCPMIEEQADLDLESVTATYNRLSQEVFPEFSVGLVHGALPQAAKEQVMRDFYEGKIQILVSTTVIEVGVDNQNAAFMVIENAERFGLAQLHQLRGRIGRGSHQSLCVLISDSSDELAQKRLKALCYAKDGFDVAEQDLKLRGPGDFFGTRQHGLPPLKVANLYHDHELMRQVQEALDMIVSDDPDLSQPEHRRMLYAIKMRYPMIFDDIGL